MNTNKTLIIAEAGVNHNGHLETALDLIDVAASAGADYVKFQTFKAEKIVSLSAPKAEYQIQNFESKESTQYSMLKRLELRNEWYPILIEKCEKSGIKFLSTGFDEESIDFLETLNVPFYKIPSGEITNKPYLEHIASKRKCVIISTGMSELGEVRDAVEIFLANGLSLEMISVLHCNTDYPTPFEDVNLKAMQFLGNELNVKYGYSDHTLGIEVPIAAVAMGASIIEKHFTLDRNMEGPDHAASLEPNELKSMINSIRNIEKAISGSGLKELSNSEIKNRIVARKSLHVNHDLIKGTVLGYNDLISLRPGDGISPMLIESVIGSILKRDLKKGDKLNYKDLII